MEESLLYIQRIKAMYQSRTFSKSDRLIADYILAHPTCVASTTAAELGEVTGTSSATVVRFCRKLGFSGLVDLKMSMAYRYANGENIIMDLDRGDNVHQIKQKVISFTKMVADHLMESLDDQALACAAQEILRAEQLVIVGEGGSGTICRAAYDIFLKLAIQCRYVSDPLFQAMELAAPSRSLRLATVLPQSPSTVAVTVSSVRPVNIICARIRKYWALITGAAPSVSIL